jgi:type IV fimbrial biogenesis protein FimT
MVDEEGAGVLKQARGFTIIELMISIALLAVLLLLAMPAFTGWIRNAQVRTVSDSLQSGARLAQAEAIRRYRQVVFFRTNQPACNAGVTAEAGGAFWAVRTVPLVAGDPVDVVQCGVLADVAGGVAIAGPTALCFNSAGRQVANADPGVGGAACVLPVGGTSAFDISTASSDRPLRVLVALGGSVRMCDPAKAFSSTAPDGCP